MVTVADSSSCSISVSVSFSVSVRASISVTVSVSVNVSGSGRRRHLLNKIDGHESRQSATRDPICRAQLLLLHPPPLAQPPFHGLSLRCSKGCSGGCMVKFRAGFAVERV